MKRLIGALETASDVQKAIVAECDKAERIQGTKRRRAKAMRNIEHWSRLERELVRVLATWKKNQWYEL